MLSLNRKSQFLAFIITACALLFSSASLEAFCVRNLTHGYISVVRLPWAGGFLSDHYKQVIAPGENKCCNWRHSGCLGSRYERAKFAIYSGDVLSDLYYREAKSLRYMLDDISHLYTELAGSPGSAVALNVAENIGFLIINQRGFIRFIYASSSEDFIRDFEGVFRLPEPDEVDWWASTLGGGMLDVHNDYALGCWSAPCRGINISANGMMGYNGSTCPNDRISLLGCCQAGYQSHDGLRCHATCPANRSCSGRCCPSGQVCNGNGQCECPGNNVITCGNTCCPDTYACVAGACQAVSGNPHGCQDCGGHKLHEFFLKKLNLPPGDGVTSRSMTPFSMERRAHMRRVTWLEYIQSVAEKAGDGKAVDRAKALRLRELKRHKRWLAIYNSGGHEKLYNKEFTP